MRGEKIFLAFIVGNITFQALFQMVAGSSPLISTLLAIIITIAIGTLFKKKWTWQYIIITYFIFFLLGGINSTRVYNNKCIIASESRLVKTIANTRDKIIEKFKAKSALIIPDSKSLAVILAFTIGTKEDIDRSLKRAYQESGAMHVLALSGLHIGIICNLMGYLLFFLGYTYRLRKIKLAIECIMIFLYTALTGFGASVMRAALMIMMYRTVIYSGRRRGKWSTWIYSAAIILLFRPSAILEIGFQLSFAAVAGIIAIYPVIMESISFGKGPIWKVVKILWSMASISVACQITTLPFAWYYFQAAPHYFLITNLFAVPLVTASIYFFGFAYLTYGIPVIGEISGYITTRTVQLLNLIIDFIGSQPSI